MMNPYAVILLHTQGKAICEDDYGERWYCEMPEEYAEAGTVLEIESLQPIGELSPIEQALIKKEIVQIPFETLEFIRGGLQEV